MIVFLDWALQPKPVFTGSATAHASYRASSRSRPTLTASSSAKAAFSARSEAS